MLKSFRYFLLPLSLIYSVIILLRNKLFDWNIIKSANFNFPIICVGNLAVGGTGKTPMVEYLVELLKDKFHTATLSRGYKRKTKGFAIANYFTTANEIGDEPMQFHLKFPDITVAVGEERLVAIPQLLHQKPETDVIILDDAFQHRHVKAGLNIVLTEQKNLFTRDFMMPAGDLRDNKSSIKRADIIIVTKCDADLSISEKIRITKEIKPLPHQKVYFTKINYGKPYHIFNKHTIELDETLYVLLICGIANPKPLKDYINPITAGYDMISYADHHIFKIEDLNEIKSSLDKIPNKNKVILTTEKDAVRLDKFKSELMSYPIYAIPINHEFLFIEEKEFNERMLKFVSSLPVITNR